MRHSAGRDWQSRVMHDTASTGSGAYAAATYIGLSPTLGTPADADTTLVGEYSSGTLLRKQAVYAHTTGSSVATLTAVFTSDQVTTPARYGVFNAASGGTMPFSNPISPASQIISGDQETITHTTGI